MKANIIYWSGTGNTESLANDLATALEKKGYETVVESIDNKDNNYAYDLFLLGCPACGAEQLGDEFDAYYQENKEKFADKKTILFGCFDWGSAEWIETWKEDAESSNIKVLKTIAVNMADLGDVDADELLSDVE